MNAQTKSIILCSMQKSLLIKKRITYQILRLLLFTKLVV